VRNVSSNNRQSFFLKEGIVMRNSTVIVLAAIVLSCPPTIEIHAAADSAPPAKPVPSMNGAGVLQGRLLKIDGDLYIIKDAAGKEVRVHVNKATVLDSRIKAGDKIDVQMAADGHAAAMLKALE
jgi:hypothetical protein